MRICVTGGSGFIGKAVAKELKEASYDVSILDIVTPGNHLKGVPFIKADITDFSSLKNALKDFEVVYHIAGLFAETANSDPYQAALINYMGTANVLESCRLNGIEKIIFASTFLIYDGKDGHVDEDTPIDPRGLSIFASSKLFAEELIKSFSKKYGIKYVILRYGSVFGPGGGTNVIRTFIEQAFRRENISVWGEGKRARQFVCVNDSAKGSRLALSQDNDTFNLAGSRLISNREVLEKIRDIIPSIKYSFELDKKERVDTYVISIKKAQEKMGWTDATDFEMALKETTEGFKTQYGKGE